MSEVKLQSLLENYDTGEFPDGEGFQKMVTDIICNPNATNANISSYSSLIFNTIPQFLKKQMENKDKQVVGIKVRSLNILSAYIKARKSKLLPNALLLKELATAQYKCDPGAKVKGASLNLISTMIKEIPNISQVLLPSKLASIMISEIKSSKAKPGVKGAIMVLSGMLIKHYSPEISMLVFEIQDLMYRIFTMEIMQEKPELACIVGLLKGMTYAYEDPQISQPQSNILNSQ